MSASSERIQKGTEHRIKVSSTIGGGGVEHSLGVLQLPVGSIDGELIPSCTHIPFGQVGMKGK